jgi:DNA-binding transcriptional ArsR family regulator
VNTYGETFEALGDSTRREIVEHLRAGQLSVAEIAGRLPVSRPAVSQHLRVLERTGLVRFRRVGTRKIYELDRAGLEGLRTWVEGFWDDALERFVAAAEHREALDRLVTTTTKEQEEQP